MYCPSTPTFSNQMGYDSESSIDPSKMNCKGIPFVQILFPLKFLLCLSDSHSFYFLPVAVSNVAHTRDYALFVAPHGHAFALPASGFPAVRRSCVYHFATKITTRNVSGMVITDLTDRNRHHRKPLLRKLPFAGQWRPLSWFSPRCPSLDTTPARRRRWLSRS